MYGETTLGIVDETEVFASLVNRDNVHEASWVVRIGANFSIDLDQSLHDNLLDLTAVESIFQAVSEEDDEWKAVSLLVRTLTVDALLANNFAIDLFVDDLRWLGSISTGQLVKQPVRWR